MNAQLPVPTGEPINLAKRIEQYLAVRNKIKAIKEGHKAELAPFNSLLETLGAVLLNALSATGQDNAKTKAGTAYKTVKSSATIEDADAFKRHVIGSESWDLLDFKANCPAVIDFIADPENKLHLPPPGVKFSAIFEIGVRAPSATAKK
jgi:hypothetical protein